MSSQLASQRSQTPSGAPPSGIEGVSQTVAPPTPSQDGASQTTKIRHGVIPQESPDQSQALSNTREAEPPQIEDISSEDELPDSASDQEHHSGTPVLDELLMGPEELEDYHSINSSPVINKTPLWKFTEQTPSGSQAQTRTSTATSQAQPKTSTPAKPAVPQTKALAKAKPQAPAPAPVWPPAPAQPVKQAPARFPQPPSRMVICLPSESLDEDGLSDFTESEASLIAKQAWSDYLDRVAAYCELERGDPEEQRRAMGMQLPPVSRPF